MTGEDKTKKQLIDESAGPLQRIAGLEVSGTERGQVEEGSRKAYDELKTRMKEETTRLVRANKTLQTETIERKHAERKLNLYECMVESAHDAIFFKDLKSRYIVANKKTLEAFGLSREKVIGKNDYELMSDKEQARKNIEDDRVVFKTGKPKETIKHMTGENGKQYWFHAIKVPHFDTQGTVTGLIGIARDITEHKKLEEQFFQSQKMEAVGTLAGGIAHDFNNLLTVIKGNTELSLLKLDKSNPLYYDIKQIKDAADRAANLTRQLLLYSRRQPMDFVHININDTIKGLLRMLRRLIGEDIALHANLGNDVWTVRADIGNIEQVIMNLSVNARDAMPEGGTLRVKTENVRLDENYTRMYGYAYTGKFVCVSIEDTGSGMDKETLEHVFEPFFTTKEVGKGTGLGLSVVYGIVREHQGWVNVYSEPGEGTMFKIYLPAAFEQQEYVAEEKTSILDLRGKGEGVLLVEDEESVLKTTARVLREYGYIVIEALNAKEAIDIFGKEKDNIHLLFTDTILPDKNGIQLINELLVQKPDLRVLLGSGYTGEKVNRETIHKVKLPFIQKPYELNELLTIIRECLT